MGLKKPNYSVLFMAFLLLVAIALAGCAGEQLTTVQGEFVKLWSDDQVQPAALQAPPK